MNTKCTFPVVQFINKPNVMGIYLSLDQGGHAQAKVKFPVFAIFPCVF